MPPIDFPTLAEDPAYLAHVGRGVWLMDDHRWALKVWETERTTRPYTLVHADYHWDGCDEFHDEPEKEKELLLASPAQIAALVAEGDWIRLDSFIAPAIRRGLIDAVHFFCVQDSGADSALDTDLLQRCSARQFIHRDASSLAAAKIEGPSLFDLCLDLFNRSEKWEDGDLWSELEIVDFLSTVRPLVQAAELVTVSMSFNYSGTLADTRYLAGLVVPMILSFRE